jgi:hypothetical protein
VKWITDSQKSDFADGGLPRQALTALSSRRVTAVVSGGSRRFAAAAIVLWATAFSALAETEYPDRTIRMLFGFAPGVDVVARLLADKLADVLGKPVIVENVTGAGGNIAVDRVAKAAPDGYTIGVVAGGNMVVNGSLYRKLSYDPLKDLAPVTQVYGSERARGQQRRSGKERRRARRAGAGIARRADLRAFGARHLAPSRRRALQLHGAHRSPAGAVPRLVARRDRPDGRPYHHELHPPDRDAAIDE